MPFSIVMSVYKNDIPAFVRIALDSILIYQTVKPDEIVLVEDGPVSNDLEEAIKKYETEYPKVFNIIRLKENKGLGNALKIGVESAKYDIIARMDSDDISLPERFELQIKHLKDNLDIDIVGGQITEFIDDPKNIVAKRTVPLNNADIYNCMKKRCGLNHVTVMFRKQAILNAGNYLDWFWNEDYYLWVRMMINHCHFANIDEILVNVRSGTDQYARRGGIKYFNSEKAIQQLMLSKKLISPFQYIINIIERFILQILMPSWLRGWIFRKFAREKCNNFAIQNL